MNLRNPFKSLGNTFLTGLLAILPLYLTVMVLGAVFRWVDASAGPAVESLLGRRVPGAGALATLAIVFLLGIVVRWIGLVKFAAAAEKVARRVPGVGKLYATIKQLLDPLVTPESRPFRDAVWVEITPGARVMGFVTSAPFLEQAGEEERINVYLPMSHPYVGYVIAVHASQVIPCAANFEEVVSYHLSCGAALPAAYRTLRAAPAPSGQLAPPAPRVATP